MGLFNFSKKVVTGVFNLKVKDWFNYPQHQTNTEYIFGFYKKIFTGNWHALPTETFEEVVSRLNLTEQDIQARKQEFYRLFVISSIFSILIFSYVIIVYIKYQNLYGLLLGLSVTCLSLANVIKYHLWWKQIVLRKLGLSFTEWLS